MAWFRSVRVIHGVSITAGFWGYLVRTYPVYIVEAMSPAELAAERQKYRRVCVQPDSTGILESEAMNATSQYK